MPQTAPNFNHAYAKLPERFYANAQPADYPHAKLIQINDDLASELGFDLDWLHSEAGLAMLSGQILPPSAQPIAQAYAGHQFGGFVPQLGDGRAILLGEMNGHDIQLKGAGLTKYSRRGDGKSALGPVIREYLVSEAMHALGVPTTRALAAVATQEAVFRQFGPEPGGIFTRVAQSHVRVGTFQYVAATGDLDKLRKLTDGALAKVNQVRAALPGALDEAPQSGLREALGALWEAAQREQRLLLLRELRCVQRLVAGGRRDGTSTRGYEVS